MDRQTGRLIRAFDDSDILKIAITPDGRKGVTASMNRKLNVWNLDYRQEARHGWAGRRHPREDFIIFPDGRRLAQGSVTNSITIIDLETGKLIREIAPPGMVPSAFRVTPRADSLSGRAKPTS